MGQQFQEEKSNLLIDQNDNYYRQSFNLHVIFEPIITLSSVIIIL
jgi:hypothetical protein